MVSLAPPGLVIPSFLIADLNKEKGREGTTKGREEKGREGKGRFKQVFKGKAYNINEKM